MGKIEKVTLELAVMSLTSLIDNWRCALPTVTFAADGRTALGVIVRNAAKEHGLDWKDCGDSKAILSDSVVMVGTVSQLGRLESVRERQIRQKYEGREDELCYGSCYRVELGKEQVLLAEPPDDYDMGESLLDWMLTEWFYYERGRFLFLASDGTALESLTRFEVYLGELARRLRKILNREP